MSIDRNVFVEWMGELDDHFPGERSERVVAVYWKALSERMGTAAFERACIEILGSREYFPPWRAFLEAVDGDSESEAMAAWERVMEMAKDWRRADPNEELDEAGQRALRQVGGIRRLAMADASELPFRRKDFLAAYQAGPSRERDELPPMTEQGREQLAAAAEGTGLLEGGR